MLTCGCQELQFTLVWGFFSGEGEAVWFLSEMSNLCNSWETADADSLASFKKGIAYLCGIEEHLHLH